MALTKNCWQSWKESPNQGDDICGVGDFPALAFRRTFGMVNSAGLPRMPRPRAWRSLRSGLISARSATQPRSSGRGTFFRWTCEPWDATALGFTKRFGIRFSQLFLMSRSLFRLVVIPAIGLSHRPPISLPLCDCCLRTHTAPQSCIVNHVPKSISPMLFRQE